MHDSMARLALALAVFGGFAGTASAADYVVSFKHLPVAHGERVMGLQLDTHAAYFSMVRQMPLGWRLAIDNDGTWNAQVKGSAIVGVAALEPAALNGMFHVITSDELGPAQVSGELVLVNEHAQERHVRLAPSTIHLTAATH